jgi:DNA primase
VENVVASSGTSLTTGQIQLIKRFTNKVTVLYDGDWAGIKASLRGIDMLLEEGLEIKVALFPDGEDPDSFARKHTREELLDFLTNNEEDFISFKQRLLAQELNKDPLQRAKLIGEVVNSIAVIPDAIVRTVYIEQTASKLNIKEELLQQEVAKLRQKKQSDNYYQQQREKERLERLQGLQAADTAAFASPAATDRKNIPGFVVNTYCSEAEKEILYYLLKFGNLPIHVDEEFAYGAEQDEEQTVAQYILAQLQNDELELQNLQYKEIFNEYFQLKEHESEKVLRYFMNHPNTEVSKIVADLFIQPYTITIQQFSKSIIPERNVLGRVVPKSILIYKAKVTAQAAMNLTEELGKAQREKNTDLQNELMGQLNTLMQVRNFFSKELNRIIL